MIAGETLPHIFPQDDEGQSLRWGKFKNRDSREVFGLVGQKVFPFIKNLSGLQ